MKQRRISMAATLADRALTLIAEPASVSVLAATCVSVLGIRIRHAFASTTAFIVVAGIHLELGKC